MKRWCGLFAILILFGAAGMAFGAGFHIAEQGAKAMAMGNAFAAQADDPSALYYNPAGIAFQHGIQVNTGITIINVPETKFEGTTRIDGFSQLHDERARRDIFIAPTFYGTASLESVPISFGFGVNSLYPLAKKWSITSPFRDTVQEISIKPLNFQPTIAYRYDPFKIAVAAGVDVTYAQVALNKQNFSPFPPPSGPYTDLGDLDLQGTGTGVGYNFGALWKPIPSLSFGVTYRSKIEIDIEGDAEFLPTATGSLVVGGTTQNIATTGSTDITLPDRWSFAVAWKPIEKVTLEFDADRFGWSSFDKLEFSFASPQLAAFNNKPTPKNWKDSWAYRFGTQYAVNDILDVRAGYAYDETPIPNETLGPELPDSNRQNLSFGFGVHNDRGALDVGYMWVHFNNRTVYNNIQNGTYESDAHLIGANVTWKF